jgi:hypothetical protein
MHLEQTDADFALARMLDFGSLLAVKDVPDA